MIDVGRFVYSSKDIYQDSPKWAYNKIAAFCWIETQGAFYRWKTVENKKFFTGGKQEVSNIFNEAMFSNILRFSSVSASQRFSSIRHIEQLFSSGTSLSFLRYLM